MFKPEFSPNRTEEEVHIKPVKIEVMLSGEAVNLSTNKQRIITKFILNMWRKGVVSNTTCFNINRLPNHIMNPCDHDDVNKYKVL